jgi:hypothetical protein
MKYHKIHPTPLADGRYREALIEFNIDELKGLLQVIVEALKSPDFDKMGRIFISFENRELCDDPAINCWYDLKKEKEK